MVNRLEEIASEQKGIELFCASHGLQKPSTAVLVEDHLYDYTKDLFEGTSVEVISVKDEQDVLRYGGVTWETIYVMSSLPHFAKRYIRSRLRCDNPSKNYTTLYYEVFNG